MAAFLRHIVEFRVLAVEDIQSAVVRTRQVVQAEPFQLMLVVGTVELDMVVAMQRQHHTDWVPERQLDSRLMLPVECRKM